MAKKTDNHNAKAKLDLRRYFLSKYHADGDAQVLDCCQGSAVLWSALQKEFRIANYWGVDVKPKKGRLKIDSVRILQQPGWRQNVVDIDTYGSPWKHWLAMLPNVVRPTTCFLTLAMIRAGGGGTLSAADRAILGLDKLEVPPGIQGKLAPLVARLALGKAMSNGILLQECVEAVAHGNARYIGVRLMPQQKEPADAPTSTGSPLQQERC